MTVYSIWPTFVCLALLMLLTYLPGFDRAGFKSTAVRVNAIDGVRGFLALGVAIHHSVIYYQFVRSGIWQVPPSRFYTLIGQVSVACFFMITGYLFWAKIVRSKGRLDFAELMKGRFFRLAPVYCLAVSLAVAIIFWKSSGVLKIPLSQYLLQIIQNMAIGIFPFTGMNNEPSSATILAGVTWTLQYEWQFYFALPALAIFARQAHTHLPFAIVTLLTALVLVLMSGSSTLVFYVFFACGMVSASLEVSGYLLKLPKFVLSVLCTGCLIAIMLLYGSAYRPEVALLLGLAFYFLISGADLFGFLIAKPCIRLGEISYAVYMMQGLVLYALFAIQPFRDFAMASDLNFWIAILGVLVSLVLLALAVHLFVERPGVELGRGEHEGHHNPASAPV